MTRAWVMGIAAALSLGIAHADGTHEKDKQQQKGMEDQQSILEKENLKLDQLNEEQVRNLQTKLSERGFYQGDIDGKMDQDVRSAWNDFQRSEGMQASDEIDQRSADLIGFTIITVQPVRGEDAQQQAGGKAPKAAYGQKELTFEVLGVDRQNQTVYFTRKDLGEIGVQRGEMGEIDPEIWLQSGRDFAMSFQQLEQAVEGAKKGSEIAQELHEGENVTITTDAKGRVKKLEY